MGTFGVNVAVLHDAQILLTEREDFHVWCMPGGHIEPHETFPQAARREVLEETGLDVAITRLVGIYSRPQWDQYHILVFAAEPRGGVQRAQPGEVLRMRFFPLDDLPDALLIGQRQRILDVFNGRSAVCRSENFALPFGRPLTREEEYHLRDESGLSPHDFYLRYITPMEAGDSVVEVGPDTTR
jgi:ADP-ribose pyrophosphatase YjhB (NUDIX family)